MSIRLPIVAALLFAGSTAFAQSDAERFAALIKRAQSSNAPGIGMLVEFWSEKDIDLSNREIRAAITRAGLGANSPLAEGLRSIQRITKRGSTVTLKRDREEVINLGDGYLRLQPTVSFKISSGYLEGLSRTNRNRLNGADTDYGYVHLSEFKGVKVGETRRIMVNLYELYHVLEDGEDVIHGRGGVRIWTEWRRVEVPRQSARAASDEPAQLQGAKGALGRHLR